MTWEDAKAECAKLGDGWRLPTKDELDILYRNRQTIGGFVGDVYWSSTEYGNYSAWRQSFSNGFQNFSISSSTDNSVRAVRTF